MLCKISDLLVEIPTAGGLALRCRDYIVDSSENADIVIREDLYNMEKGKGLPKELVIYLESGLQFYRELLRFDGMMLHASAVALDGKAYLFSGPCGIGKSTHTRLWQQLFGDAVQIFNDDKPALRRLDGRWIAYGTPWCGKDGINTNMRVPLAGICFLRRGDQNVIHQLNVHEAMTNIISQTLRRFRNTDRLDMMLSNVEKLAQEIPVYELFNRPERAAAELSYQVMSGNSPEVSYED